MSPPQSAGGISPTSRRKQIPGTLVLNWQSPETQASKPLIRRPMTACEACRAAKVKCNGHRSCERCTSRGLHCTYTPSPNTQDINASGNLGAETVTLTSPPNSQSSCTPSIQMLPSQTTPDPIPVSLPDDIFPLPSCSASAVQSVPTDNALEHWREETFNQGLEQFDWVFPEADIGPEPSQNPSQSDFNNFFPHPPEPIPRTVSRGSAPLSDPPVISPRSQHQSRNCQCRANMMHHVPKIECAIQEKPKPQLDKMFKVTGDVIRSCQESTRCGCYVGPVDLVCIMSVFEQTAVCFDYIAKSGFDGTVKVGIGNYCVSLNDDASLKRMLVLDLVRQADTLLDSVSVLAQNMFVSLNEPSAKSLNRSPACLNQLNLDYVREATASFKKLFRLITEYFEGFKAVGQKEFGVLFLLAFLIETATNHPGTSPHYPDYQKPPAKSSETTRISPKTTSSNTSTESVTKHGTFETPSNNSPSLPYPCIGVFRFLDFGAHLSPIYPEVIQRLRAGQTFLDLGCCFGQDIRKLVHDGAPSENIIGADTEGRFMDLGYELFRDKETLKARFYAASVFDEDFLSEWHGKIDVIYVGAFLHLFDIEKQALVVARLVELLRRRPGSIVFGRNLGAERGGAFRMKTLGWDVFRHSRETMRLLWEGAPEGDWRVDAELMEYRSEGWDDSRRGWVGDETKEMRFVVRRL
ncbi:hypothetical protein AO1008_08037 [Aspergillus oryzae 100-8]|uniref:Zn(2)-C6 fungal-type domain-containing protein n=1 Tax=Aspergillus oryzae (strain 3.042) TaxID=1160506 RepID=I8U4P9_ASPO3|nr:hypothetical protein Ao3042_01597 [Aspergillus oryzae 3.042]KDE81728.1 hypothetical protein AO1008_08037 [Aspergillus oryzae 100-8]|eukprot:EIT81835.1 hypothetical protein Ao3042_01597 [Aspergillus oryzae 3.042]